MSLQVVSVLLDALEDELRDLKLWSQEAPAASALGSREPFCIDTLSFDQWLQWVFVARLRILLATREPLPKACGVAPMAQEYFKFEAHKYTQLCSLLAKLDGLLNEA